MSDKSCRLEAYLPGTPPVGQRGGLHHWTAAVVRPDARQLCRLGPRQHCYLTECVYDYFKKSNPSKNRQLVVHYY